MSAVSLVALVVETVKEPMARLGFTKRAGRIFTSAFGGDSLGWVGLNTASEHRAPEGVEVNLVVGVRNQHVERLVAELRGETFHPYLPPTVRSPLGYLSPERRYRPWLFEATTVRPLAAEMVGSFAQHGVAFIRRNAGLEGLCQGLDEGLSSDHDLPYRRSAAWLVAGDPVQALEIVDEAMAGLEARTDLAAGEFRRFAVNLRERAEDGAQR